MAKKGAKKKRHVTHHIKVESVPSLQAPNQRETNTNQVLLENFVSLQRVLTNLALKVDSLTTQISKLLELFEISAKALAEKDFEIEKDNKNMLERLDKLLDQNKVLARGISLMHERIPNQEQYYPPMQPIAPPLPPQSTQNSPYIREIQEPQRKPMMQQQMFQPSQQPIRKPQPQYPPQQENTEMPEPPSPEEPYQEFESPFEEQQ
jgi:hypothetical protein